MISSLVVRLATVVLPAGSVRERYRSEFLAELHGLTHRARLGFALGVAINALALRLALGRQDGPADLEFVPRRKPLRCRLGMHHYRWANNPDGEPYLRCTRCGDDKGGTADGVSLSGNISTASFGFG